MMWIIASAVVASDSSVESFSCSDSGTDPERFAYFTGAPAGAIGQKCILEHFGRFWV